MRNMKSNLKTIAISLGLFIAATGLSHAKEPLQPGWPLPVHDDPVYTKFLMDRLEYVAEEEPYLAMDSNLWIGGDYHRLYVKAEGEHTPGAEMDMSVDLMYSRIVFPYWDVQAGLSSDYQQAASGDSNSRYSLALGVMGLAPYWFETDASLYISQDGDISGVLELEYEWLFTQRTVLQARLETMAAMQAVSEFGIHSGFNNVETGLRLRHEIRREFAPYIGVDYHQTLGTAARVKADAGSETGEILLLGGIRFWL